MTRRPPADPIDIGRPLDPLWYIGFPIYFFFMLGYGVFAALYYLPQLRGPAAGSDPAAAQLFGVLVAVSAVLGLIGSLTTIIRRRDGLELVGTAAVTIMMCFYFLTLTVLVGVVHDPGTRPGSAFVPMCMGVFPAIRWAVIVRDRKRRCQQVTT